MSPVEYVGWKPVFPREQYLARAAVVIKPEAVSQHPGVAEHHVSAVRPLRVYHNMVVDYSLTAH